VCLKQFSNFGTQVGIIRAEVLEHLLLTIALDPGRGGKERARAPPSLRLRSLLHVFLDPVGFSARLSHARATVQSRLTVAGEMSSATAVSSRLMPANT